MKYRTDLVDEEVASELIQSEKRDNSDIDVKVVHLNEEEAKQYNRKPGLYSTLNTTAVARGNIELEEDVTKELIQLIKKSIEFYELEKMEKVFIVGLGNKLITPDAVGPLVVEKIIVTNHLEDDYFDKKVIALAPGVMGQTGMETATIIKSVAKTYKPDLVIVIDALASKSTKRLFKSIQLATTGIAPGSGVGNNRKELSKKTLGCDVLAIGIPTVVDLISVLYDYKIEEELDDNLFLTTKEVDEEVQETSIIIAKALNCALHDIELQN